MAKTYKTIDAARSSKSYRELRAAGKTDSEAIGILVPSRAGDAEEVETVPASGVTYEQRDAAIDSWLSNAEGTSEEE